MKYFLLLIALIVSTDAFSQKVTYLHTDVFGNVVMETDENANVIARYEYEPFGLPVDDAPEGPGFGGHAMDGDSGLIYMQQRYYDPISARFISIDPMAVDAVTGFNFNRYAYANNNPYRFADPDGRMAVPMGAAGCALSGPACPAGAVVGAVIGKALTIGIVAAVIGGSDSDDAGGDLPAGEDIKIDEEKIGRQIDDRGWSEEEVRDLTKSEPSGVSVDNTGGRNDPATVYGTPEGHVVINDKTGDVVQVSDKNDPDWTPDSRIQWKDDRER